MGAYGAPDAAIAGLIVGIPNAVESAIAKEIIPFGAPVFGMVGVENKAYNYHTEIATVSLNADLAADDTLAITVNGTLFDVTFATTHAAAITAMIAEINASTAMDALGISAAAGDAREVIVNGPADLTLVVTSAVTSTGSGTADASVVLSSARKFLGAAAFVQTGGKTWGAGTSAWQIGMSVNIVADGTLWVPVESTVADKDPAYAVSLGAGTLGKFTDVSTSNYDIGGYFRSNVDNGLAILEVRGLK